MATETTGYYTVVAEKFADISKLTVNPYIAAFSIELSQQEQVQLNVVCLRRSVLIAELHISKTIKFRSGQMHDSQDHNPWFADFPLPANCDLLTHYTGRNLTRPSPGEPEFSSSNR
jgi:hypothetical protein